MMNATHFIQDLQGISMSLAKRWIRQFSHQLAIGIRECGFSEC
jgi:hypothetical protein